MLGSLPNASLATPAPEASEIFPQGEKRCGGTNMSPKEGGVLFKLGFGRGRETEALVIASIPLERIRIGRRGRNLLRPQATLVVAR